MKRGGLYVVAKLSRYYIRNLNKREGWLINYYRYIILILILICSGCTDNTTIIKNDEPSVVINEIPQSIIEENTQSEKDISNNVFDDTVVSDSASVNYTEYVVNLEIDPDKRIVTSIEKIKYYNTTGVMLDNIYVNFYLNAFRRDNDYSPFFTSFSDKVFKYGKDYSVVNVTGVSINNEDVSFSLDDIILSIDLDEPLMPNNSVEIILQFDCYIPKICHRTGANDNAMWFGNFIPTLAVFDHNGWNLDKYHSAGDPFYSRIANYSVTIETPKDYKVISTSMGTVIENENKNKNKTVINAKMVRDFTFAIGKNYMTDSIITKDDVTINFHYYSHIENINEFMELAKKSVEYYSELIGSYPYQYLHIIESELFIQGGMEYPQFIMIDQQYLKSPRAKISLVHEIAHQWFYNIIGNNQITEAWIDEGLATLMQLNILYTDKEIEKMMQEDYNSLNRNFESKLKDNPNFDTTLVASVDSFKTWQSYHEVFYSRSKLMFYSLRKKIGAEKFNEFLKTYYKKYAFKEVSTWEIIKTVEEVYGDDLTDFFNSWIFDLTLPPL